MSGGGQRFNYSRGKYRHIPDAPGALTAVG